VESTQVHASVRRAYYVPTPTWRSAVEVPFWFPARMPRIVAYFGTALHRGESTTAAAILATQLVLEVAGVWFASTRTKGYLWHLPASLVDSPVGHRLANVAKGTGADAGAYLSELLDLHQSLDWVAAGPYLAGQVGREEGEAPRAVFHCNKRLVGGRIGLREGLLLERHAQHRCNPCCCKNQNSRNQVLTGFEPSTPGRDPKVTSNESGSLTSHYATHATSSWFGDRRCIRHWYPCDF